MEEIEALRDALDRLQAGFDDLAVRGLRAAGPADLKTLAALRRRVPRCWGGVAGGAP